MPVTTYQRVNSLVKSVAVEVHRRFGSHVKVIWFGSWVLGTARQNSDIDIAIDAPKGLSMKDFAMLWSWVEELPTLYSIDLVKLDEVGDGLRQEILNTGLEV